MDSTVHPDRKLIAATLSTWLLIFVFAMKYSAQIEEALLGLVRRIVPKRNRSDRN